MTKRRRSWILVPLVATILVAACASPAEPSVPGSVPPSVGPVDTGPIAEGPLSITLPEFPPADPSPGLIAQESTDRARARTEAGFAVRVGPGWVALSGAADAAIDSAVRSLAPKFGVPSPVVARDARLASIVRPSLEGLSVSHASAAAVALIMGALSAGQALGSGGTRESSNSASETTTDGDNVASVTAAAHGTIVSTGSRVVADFSFELTGQVVNSVTGATSRMHGTATAHIEIDGCPDAGGSSKGKVAIVSSEDVAGADGGSAGWRRQLSGDFDISVDDSASISGVVNNIDANETVQGGPGDPDADSHELGITGHWEATAGTGFSGMAETPGATTGDVYHERDATRDQVRALARSAAYAVNAAAVLLGQAAERFWRNGKCVELIVDPAGGDVDPDSVTDVVAKLKHRFEGNELDKPVEANLTGLKAVDPLNQKQPAPATVKFTAGPNEGDVGEVAFRSVSNRGIAEKSVKFTVRKPAWDVTFDGTDVETFAPVVKNTFDATLVGLKIEARDSALTGTGKLRLSGTVTSGACSGHLDVTATSKVTGTLVGTGPEATLRITITSTSPASAVVVMHCPGRSQRIGGQGHAERFGEALMEFDLPAAGGTLRVSKSASIGGVMHVVVKGTFKVTLARP